MATLCFAVAASDLNGLYLEEISDNFAKNFEEEEDLSESSCQDLARGLFYAVSLPAASTKA